jgi:hypothetical protein
MNLERYADVSALVTDVMNDPAACAERVQAEGIRPEDWEAAKAGWTQKMQSMSDFGQTATKYMQLYQAALNRRGGTTQVTYEEYVAMRALGQLQGIEGMLQSYGLTMGDWTQIAGHWNNEVGNNMIKYAGINVQIAAEVARLRSGGAPRPVSVQKAAPNPNAPVAPQPAAGGAFGFAGVANSLGNLFGGAARPAAQPAHAQPAPAQPAHAQPAPAQPAPATATPPFAPGSTVSVQWSDGNRYPAQVQQAHPDKCLVKFTDGRELWVDAPYLQQT